jgi:hypothetical protein
MTKVGNPLRSHFWTWPALAILCAVGMWTYVQRVLIAHQISYAETHDRPRGNLSDLYPRWLGARELLLHKRNPYGADISREIQAGYYGRPLDASRASDPKDEQGFAYPIYVVFFLAPTIGLHFAIVQKSFFWILVLLTCVSVLLWLKILRWRAAHSSQISLVLFTLGILAIIQGLKLQQISLLVAGLLSVAMLLFVRDHLVTAGILLGVATIKPQLVLPMLCWLTLWTFADWRLRYRWVVSFLLTMAILCAGSEWLMPHWILCFWQAVRDYQKYTANMSIVDSLIGTPVSWVLELIALAAMIGACWRERRQPANSLAFVFVLCLVLAMTVLLLPSSSTYNQVLLIPALLLLVKDRHNTWRRSPASRILFALLVGLVCWPWISGVALAALSFILPPNSFDRVWALPTWTLAPIPVAVAALMLVNYYQTTFDTPAASTRRRMLGNQPPAQER